MMNAQYVHNKRNTMWKVLCTVLAAPSLFRFQKKHARAFHK